MAEAITMAHRWNTRRIIEESLLFVFAWPITLVLMSTFMWFISIVMFGPVIIPVKIIAENPSLTLWERIGVFVAYNIVPVIGVTLVWLDDNMCEIEMPVRAPMYACLQAATAIAVYGLFVI